MPYPYSPDSREHLPFHQQFKIREMMEAVEKLTESQKLQLIEEIMIADFTYKNTVNQLLKQNLSESLSDIDPMGKIKFQ